MQRVAHRQVLEQLERVPIHLNPKYQESALLHVRAMERLRIQTSLVSSS
jgi:hypothetical protein